jgi:hypothetical protein
VASCSWRRLGVVGEDACGESFVVVAVMGKVGILGKQGIQGFVVARECP